MLLVKKTIVPFVIAAAGIIVACSSESGRSSVQPEPPGSLPDETTPATEIFVEDGSSVVESDKTTGFIVTDSSLEPGTPSASSARFQLHWVNPNE